MMIKFVTGVFSSSILVVIRSAIYKSRGAKGMNGLH